MLAGAGVDRQHEHEPSWAPGPVGRSDALDLGIRPQRRQSWRPRCASPPIIDRRQRQKPRFQFCAAGWSRAKTNKTFSPPRSPLSVSIGGATVRVNEGRR
jgi:hypothetical protein